MTASAKPGPQRSGVYRSPTDLDRIQGSLGTAIRWIDFSLRDVHDKAGLMGAFANAFDFPQTFGANWDALADALQDSALVSGEGSLLHVRDSGMSRLPQADRAILMDVLSSSATYWRGHGKAFIVLVDGATQLPLWT
jgi:RNAse (barnase) inhibitor barstar